jgi:hypothetical protein
MKDAMYYHFFNKSFNLSCHVPLEYNCKKYDAHKAAAEHY